MKYRELGHVVNLLMGYFKVETEERNLMIVLANITSIHSGLEVCKWIYRLSALHGTLVGEQRV